MNKSWIKALSIFIIIMLLSPSLVVNAQQTAPSGPIYIVQEGDSLWDIAYRFHVSQDALAIANGLVNADQITIGQQLVIPGLEGIQGILTTLTIPFGETLESLGLRYQISQQMFKRLNHITSPNELYAGYSVIIPQNSTSPALGERITLGMGQSMLELAILNHSDPWSMMVGNGINHSWSVVPGVVLRTMSGDDTGPGALPPVISSVSITGLSQGKTAEIKIAGDLRLSINGSLSDHILNFFPDADNSYTALQGIHAMAEPGIYPLLLQVERSDNSTFSFSQMVLVHEGDFPYDRSLPVDPETLDPETNRIENELWFASSSAISPDTLWNGTFFLPIDPYFAGCYTSRFGNRRSYNGSDYSYFHSGLDFCGQVGDPVYAAAPGIVVFADLLTVRGNATMIDHGRGIFTAYMHQSEILVNLGDHVEQGQLIGRVGNTGRAEGPHLHFEVLVGGVQVDPLEWLNREIP